MKKFLALLSLCILATACSPTGTESEAPLPIEKQEIEATRLGPGVVSSFDGEEIAFTVHRLEQPTVVFVHGWLCDQTYWDTQIEGLAEAFGVVTLDLAGHGLSGTSRTEWTTASLGEDVKAVVEEVGLEKVVVIGHSMGGRVALEVARMLPDVVIGVVGVDTLHSAVNEMDPERFETFLAGFEEDFDTACEAMVRGMFVETSDGTIVDRVTNNMCEGPGPIGAALLREYFYYDVASALQATEVPVRCINADLWPTDIEGNQKYADFEAEIVPGQGHFLMQEAPGELEEALIDTVLGLVAEGGDVKE